MFFAVLFCCINFVYMTNFVKKMFVFVSIFFLLSIKKEKKYALNLIVFKVFFPSFFKATFNKFNKFNKCESHDWHNFLTNGFFQSPFEANKMFCLPNKFVLFTNHKQPLKCVQQNSYLDLWSNTLYIIWLGVYL